MSTKGVRDFRPQLHFTPKNNWINDPNGLVKVGDVYHLFAQYNPEDTVWGPMHWYHATSKNLIDWQHLPVALAPDALGAIFSGSALYDEENVSGFGDENTKPIVAMFTSHGDSEQQSIAYSLDGVNFHMYENNPVIANPGLPDFRDPKVFWNPVHNGWSMVLAASDRVFFYKTSDLKHWEKTGEFGHEGTHLLGTWECTDLFPLKAPNGETKWILVGSMTNTKTVGVSNTQYFIGDFDGDRFINTDPHNDVLRIDYGFDNYAGVTYNNSEQPIFLGWATHWHYAAKTPTNEYCGQMTLPRTFSLVDTPCEGLRLATSPIEYDAYRNDFSPLESVTSSIGHEVFELVIDGEGDCCVRLENACGQHLTIGVKDNAVYFDRSHSGAVDFHEDFSSERFSKTAVDRLYTGAYSLRLIFDVSIFELYVDEGTRVFTAVVYPDEPYTTVKTEGNVAMKYAPIVKK